MNFMKGVEYYNNLTQTAKEIVEEHARKCRQPLKVYLQPINRENGLWSCDIRYLNNFISHSGYGLPQNVEEDAFERFLEKVVLSDSWTRNEYSHWLIPLGNIRKALTHYKSILFIDGDNKPPDDIFLPEYHSEPRVLSKMDTVPLHHPHILKILVCSKESDTLPRCAASIKPLHTFLVVAPCDARLFIFYLSGQIRLLYSQVNISVFNSTQSSAEFEKELEGCLNHRM